MKRCSKCGEPKPLVAFNSQSMGRPGLRPHCKACEKIQHKAYYERNKDRLSERAKIYRKAHADRGLAYQRAYQLRKQTLEAGRPPPGLCELCNEPPSRHSRLSWDHCHQTGAFRGWICERCNLTLGRVRDSAELLRRMADYLERNK